ncbi:MAG: hypothetical protein QOD56_909, partial [Gammaproteobacteria bacterium]|nr:hypothetical protein [Gammaproteobacteria bacterium]
MRGAWWSIVIFLCVTGHTEISAAAMLDPELAHRVDATVSEWLASSEAPSASIAIVRGGALVYAKAYGLARLEPRAIATTATGYAVDSLTKEFTAAAILMLAEQGKLSLDDPLATWFPDLGAAARVTLRQLLTHTSGIRDYWPQDFVTPEMTRATTPAALIEEWARRPLDFEPGTEWQYSNTNYVLAAEVVERASGEAFFGFLQRSLFAPLGMSQVIDLTTSSPRDIAGYTRHGLGPVRAAPKEAAGWLFGAASLAMQPTDLALWDVSLIDRSLLRARSYEAALTPVALKSGATAPYGFGFDIEDIQGRRRIGHSGGGSGFLADNRVWPAERSAIVVLTNNDWASPSELSNRLAFLLLTPSPAEARARAVFAALQSGSLDRSWFTATGNFHLDDAALAELRGSLGKLGPARNIELEQESMRGGMLTRRWKIL